MNPEAMKAARKHALEAKKRTVASRVLDARQAKRLAAITETLPSSKSLFERVYVGKAAPKDAIKAFYLECNGYERSAVTSCAASACPLWRYRPNACE